MISNLKKAVVAAVVTAPAAVFAAVPAGVTTAITEAGTDGLTILGAMAAGGAALYILWKVLGKMGIRL